VDVICRVIARSDDHQMGRQLRQRGFLEDSRPGAPLCRWCTDDLILDLMPTQGEILGFSNRWYPLALDTAQQQAIPSGRSIRIVTAPVFLATKLEASPSASKVDATPKRPFQPGGLMELFHASLQRSGQSGCASSDEPT
jgi:hypothetical protein